MAIILPTVPAPAFMNPRLVTARATLSPAFRGPTRRINRMGSRHAIDFQMPPTTYEVACDFMGLMSEDETCVIDIPQPGLDPGAPGHPVVDGDASDPVSVLSVTGVTPQYYFRPGQWISIIHAGQRYCHRLASSAIADAMGEASLTLLTQIRTPLADGDVIEVAEPKIEGFATVSDDSWAMGTDKMVRLAFTIEERA